MNAKSEICAVAILFVAAVLFAPGVVAQSAQPAAGLKNIQVLKEVPASEISETMGFIASALGVTCNFCHKGPLESDTLKTKLTARQMIRMTREINERAFGGHVEVTCYTCHQGHAVPTHTPPLWNKTPDEIAAIKKERQAQIAAAQAAGANETTPKAAETATNENLQDAAEILAGYRKAVGSEFKTIVLKGTLKADMAAQVTPIEFNIGFPDKGFPDKLYQEISFSGTTMHQAVSGDHGWAVTPGRTTSFSPNDVAGAKKQMEIFRAVKFPDGDGPRKTIGIERIGDRTYSVVESSSERRRERLYFDTQTGLLYKRSAEGHTTLGINRSEVLFDDYREVNGTKLPFRIISIGANDRSLFEFTEIQTNVALDPARFEMPAALAGK
jgi:photosynthetic reaction center cytochrome c subunit